MSSVATVLAYDTHAAVKRLQKLGFNSEQAEGIVGEVSRHSIESLATKAEIRELATAVVGMQTTLRADIRELATTIAGDRERAESNYGGLKREMNIMRWVLGLMAAGLLANLALTIQQGSIG